ncbi:hypothetical protein D1007_07794 [Hordeum vulgare]|nr:hypothetical protein D1007_07794 [Hordeum vulgare]
MHDKMLVDLKKMMAALVPNATTTSLVMRGPSPTAAGDQGFITHNCLGLPWVCYRPVFMSTLPSFPPHPQGVHQLARLSTSEQTMAQSCSDARNDAANLIWVQWNKVLEVSPPCGPTTLVPGNSGIGDARNMFDKAPPWRNNNFHAGVFATNGDRLVPNKIPSLGEKGLDLIGCNSELQMIKSTLKRNIADDTLVLNMLARACPSPVSEFVRQECDEQEFDDQECDEQELSTILYQEHVLSDLKEEEVLHSEGDSEVEEPFEVEEDNTLGSEEEKIVNKKQKPPVRRGRTTRSHSSKLREVEPDFKPSSDEEEKGLLKESDDDGFEPLSFVPPKKRKSREKKRPPRKWYNEKMDQPHEQLCLKLCFRDHHQFTNALLNLHITRSRNFKYHRNSDHRIIVECREKQCQFFMVATVIKGEKTFVIKKMILEHTVPTSTETTRVSAKWLAHKYEHLFRSDPTTGIQTIIDTCMEKYGVGVPKSMAYRANNIAIEAILGDHKLQYPRLRDYAQTVMDTNHGSRVIVTTVTPVPTGKIPHTGPRFHAMIFCINGAREGFLKGCRPFIVNNLSEVFNKYILDVRRKPIRTMCDGIKDKQMVRWHRNRESGKTTRWRITPHYSETLEIEKERAKYCKPIQAGVNLWQVTCGQQTHAVNLELQTCGCRKWNLTGIPCNHAISAINKAKRFPKDFLSTFFKKQFYLAAYEPMIFPIPGEHNWTRTPGLDIEPPAFKVKRGRMKQKRIKENFEVPKPKDSSRMGTLICGNCGLQGHRLHQATHSQELRTSHAPTTPSQPRNFAGRGGTGRGAGRGGARRGAVTGGARRGGAGRGAPRPFTAPRQSADSTSGAIPTHGTHTRWVAYFTATSAGRSGM